MLFQPTTIALLLSSFVAAILVLGMSPFAVRVARRWNLASGDESQLMMERCDYLVSTLIALVLVAELTSVLLFVFNADRMASLFTGAMCAVGTLRVNEYGFPTLLLKIAVFFGGVGWMTLHRLDRLGWDYPVIRVKYAALLILGPLLAVEAGAQFMYFSGLRGDLLTSCCSTLFGSSGVTITDNAMAATPHASALGRLGGALALVAALGCGYWATERRALAVLYCFAAFLAGAAGLQAVISTISVYVYELPHHHCPFCVLKREYGWVGYAFYLPLFGATASGFGVGLAGLAGGCSSLRQEGPRLARRLVLWSMIGFAAFAAVAGAAILHSGLRLFS